MRARTFSAAYMSTTRGLGAPGTVQYFAAPGISDMPEAGCGDGRGRGTYGSNRSQEGRRRQTTALGSKPGAVALGAWFWPQTAQARGPPAPMMRVTGLLLLAAGALADEQDDGAVAVAPDGTFNGERRR